MGQTKLLDLILSLSRPLYGVAFCLIPDSLQASQLVIDSLVLHFADIDPKVELETLESPEDVDRMLFKLGPKILGILLKLGMKREEQVRDMIQDLEMIPSQQRAFYKLGIEERAILYLKIHRNFSFSELSLIFQKNNTELVGLLNRARNRFSQTLGTFDFELPQSSV